MSRNYDNWGKLVGAVLRREKDRRLAYCESFSSSSSADLSSRFSFVGDVHESADLCSANIFFSRDVKAMEYQEIRKATSYFRPDNFRPDSHSILWESPGYRRSYYKGWIDENYVAAVKPGSGIAVAVTFWNGGDDAYWFQEKIHLSQYRHPNLVIPIGYYAGRDARIFVNEFMARGSLDHHLFIEQKPLPWATRMRVAVGAARGLAFLHNLEVPVLYGVLKTDDILLDADFNAKFSDFGIARRRDILVYPWKILATYGLHAAPELVHAAPELVHADRVSTLMNSLSTECDVYSFGVVLIELMSGIRGKEPTAWDLIMDLENKRRPPRFIDVRLEGEYPPKEAYKVAHIARQCVSEDPRSRPTMAEVVAALEKP